MSGTAWLLGGHVNVEKPGCAVDPVTVTVTSRTERLNSPIAGFRSRALIPLSSIAWTIALEALH